MHLFGLSNLKCVSRSQILKTCFGLGNHKSVFRMINPKHCINNHLPFA